MIEKMLMLLMFCSLSWSCASELPIDDPSEGRWKQIILKDAPPRRDLLLACEYAISQAGTRKARPTLYGALFFLTGKFVCNLLEIKA